MSLVLDIASFWKWIVYIYVGKITACFLWIATSFIFHFLFPPFGVFIKFSIWSFFGTDCLFGGTNGGTQLNKMERQGTEAINSIVSAALLPQVEWVVVSRLGRQGATVWRGIKNGERSPANIRPAWADNTQHADFCSAWSSFSVVIVCAKSKGS